MGSLNLTPFPEPFPFCTSCSERRDPQLRSTRQRQWCKEGCVQYRLERKQALLNPACFYVVLATNCGPEKAINGPGSEKDCFKGEAPSQIPQLAPPWKGVLLKDSLTQKRGRFKKGSGVLLGVNRREF